MPEGENTNCKMLYQAITDDSKTYYFWFIQDMQTRNAAKDIVIDVKE